MKAQGKQLQGAENDLKQLMADVTRAMEKAQEAVGRITFRGVVATAETESMTSSHQDYLPSVLVTSYPLTCLPSKTLRQRGHRGASG